ncbi:hypothetical protein DID88_001639 [Monilinia fructigena]|uniref:Uncharacterized protein n=1 Tax=Monilinia fructigena TaxID=38457 RepID=A0A395IX92_9HELO|nr:hypothetical protein DID88_001639 [Monilinia fructigena]
MFLSDRQNDEGLAERDERIGELQEELERTTSILKNTQRVVENLRQENSDLKTENENLDNVAEQLKEQVHKEKRRGKKTVEGMRRQLAGVLDIGKGYLESDGNESSETEAGESTINLQVKAAVVRKGQYLDANLARRRSSGGVAESGKKKKKRYDSGLGFLGRKRMRGMSESENMHGDGEGLDMLASFIYDGLMNCSRKISELNTIMYYTIGERWAGNVWDELALAGMGPDGKIKPR